MKEYNNVRWRGGPSSVRVSDLAVKTSNTYYYFYTARYDGIYQMRLTSRRRRRRHPCLTSVWCFRDNYPPPTPDLVVLLLYTMYFYFFVFVYILFLVRVENDQLRPQWVHIILRYYYILCEYLVNRYRIFFFSFIYNKYNGYVCVYRYNSGCTPNKNDKIKKKKKNRRQIYTTQEIVHENKHTDII